MNENANTNGQQPQAQQVQQQTGNPPQQPANNTQNAADNAKNPAESEVKTVSKTMYDQKVSELNQSLKDLKKQLEAKMSDEEKAAQAQADKDAELSALRDKVSQMETKSAFLALGIADEQAQELSKAVVSGDTDNIIKAFSKAIAAVKEKTTAEVKQEILKDGSPDFNVGGKAEGEDRNLELAKSMFKGTEQKPLSESKWAR